MPYFKKILFFGALALLAVFGFRYFFAGTSSVPSGITAENANPYVERSAPADTEKNSLSPNSSAGQIPQDDQPIPSDAILSVPFLAQAPFAVWDPLHEDACEEASLIMVKYFMDNKKSIPLADGDVEIRKMIQYEEQNGYGLSITMDQLAEIIRDFYGMKNYRVEKNITLEDLKRELAAGRPVIVPAAGKLLNNPNFRDGGPVYHMLVIIGYDGKGFITNDPGTKKGEGYRYTFDNLYDAIHDWDEQNIFNGQKAYLVFD